MDPERRAPSRRPALRRACGAGFALLMIGLPVAEAQAGVDARSSLSVRARVVASCSLTSATLSFSCNGPVPEKIEKSPAPAAPTISVSRDSRAASAGEAPVERITITF